MVAHNPLQGLSEVPFLWKDSNALHFKGNTPNALIDPDTDLACTVIIKLFRDD